MTDLISLTSNISYISATENPLSCDVVLIKTDKSTWIYDVGANKNVADKINQIEGTKNVVISHFHADHITNLSNIKYDNLYVSRNTKGYTKSGEIIDEITNFDENPQIRLFPVPSSHAKGCLGFVCGEYAFLGDSTYSKMVGDLHTFNAQLLQAQIKLLASLPVKYICLDHNKEFVYEKNLVLMLQQQIYNNYDGHNPTIVV